MMDLAGVPVAILAGGVAKRLGPSTASVPKALIEVAGRPFIDHQLRLLRRHGVRRVVLCVGHLGEQIERHVKDGAAHGLDVRYSRDGDRLLGTGGALRRAGPLLGEVFWVTYGDTLLDFDYRATLAEFLRGNALGLMTVLRNDNRWDRSNVLFLDGALVRYDKTHPTPDMEHIDYGAALLRRRALERIPAEGPYDLGDLYQTLASGGALAGVEVTRRFYEIGSPDGLAETRAFLEAERAREHARGSAET